MLSRVAKITVSVLLGICVGAMMRGTWPEYTWQTDRGGKALAAQDCKVPDEILKLAGMTEVKGPGLRMVLEDSQVNVNEPVPAERMLVHERHLLLLTNELKAAGAESLSVNGNRMVADTAIRCTGPAISINGRETVPPYEVLAIGQPDVMKQSVMMMGGVVELLATENIQVEVEMPEEITIPAYSEKTAVGKAVRGEVN